MPVEREMHASLVETSQPREARYGSPPFLVLARVAPRNWLAHAIGCEACSPGLLANDLAPTQLAHGEVGHAEAEVAAVLREHAYQPLVDVEHDEGVPEGHRRTVGEREFDTFVD